MAITAPKPNPYAQDQIDKMNRYLKNYSTFTNPNAAQQKTYQNIVNTYGQNAIQNNQITPYTLQGQQERAYRQANPYSDYSKQKEVRFLNQLDNMYVNNQGVSSAQLNEYNTLANKWNIDPTKNRITNDITKQVQNEIDMKKKALQDELAMSQQANDSAIAQNNAYLSEQLGKLGQQKAVNDNQSQVLANRRGGFYSGGLDYQLGQNASSFNEQSGALSRDVGARNADIQSKNALLASQAASSIQQLESQAPDLIRQRVQDALNQQKQFAMQEAGLTGMYNGKPTLEAQGQLWNQNFQQQQFDTSNQHWQAEFDQDVKNKGLEYALNKQVQLGNLSIDQARLALQQDQFTADQQAKATEQPKVNLNTYTSQLNKQFTKKDKSGQITVTDKDGLYRSIIGLGLDDNSTIQLLSMYGYDVSGFLGQ